METPFTQTFKYKNDCEISYIDAAKLIIKRLRESSTVFKDRNLTVRGGIIIILTDKKLSALFPDAKEENIIASCSLAIGILANCTMKSETNKIKVNAVSSN